MYDELNETVSAKSYISFNLNLMLLMLNCGRNEEAQLDLARLTAAIDALDPELHINVPRISHEA